MYINSHILYNFVAVYAGIKTVTENDFRDGLVLQIIQKYGREKRQFVTPGRPPASSCRVRHGSQLNHRKQRCQYCRIQGSTQWTQRRCCDCLHMPALCQTTQRDCHSSWHEPSFDVVRDVWFQKRNKTQNLMAAHEPSPRGRGRPHGAINKRRRRGQYCS